MKYSFDGPFLVTRSEGERIRRELEDAFEGAVAAGQVLELDFTAVTAMTHSFVDECIGQLLSRRATGDVPEALLIATGLSDETAEEIDVALSRRRVGLVHADGERLVLLGADDYLRETYLRAAERGEFKAMDLADDLQTTPQNINNRLKQLVGIGALQRLRSSVAGGGREFLYQLPTLAR